MVDAYLCMFIIGVNHLPPQSHRVRKQDVISQVINYWSTVYDPTWLKIASTTWLPHLLVQKCPSWLKLSPSPFSHNKGIFSTPTATGNNSVGYKKGWAIEHSDIFNDYCTSIKRMSSLTPIPPVLLLLIIASAHSRSDWITKTIYELYDLILTVHTSSYYYSINPCLYNREDVVPCLDHFNTGVVLPGPK